MILECILNIHTQMLLKFKAFLKSRGMRASSKNQGIFKTGGMREPLVKINGHGLKIRWVYRNYSPMCMS